MTLHDASPHQSSRTLPLSEHGLWKERNAEGLALAARGEWAGATAAFEQAVAYVDALTANDTITRAARDNSRAKVFLNLAQSHFHAGALAEARHFAERSLGIRVALYGEDSLVVARTRSDLAVILGALGERQEATSLLDRAVAAVERKPVEQSAQLLPVLTSAARILTHAEEADPAAELVEARLEVLVKKQEEAAANAEIFVPMAIPTHSFQQNAFASGNDDQPLRAAIAETANLLRTTPPSNVATNINLDDAVFDLIEPPPPTLSAIPNAAGNVATGSPLGFEVQYGIPTQLHEPLQNAETMEIPITTVEPQVPASSEAEPVRRTPPELLATNTPPRSAIRAVGGPRRGSTQLYTPKLMWYFMMALGAFGAGAVITVIVMYLRR